VPLLNYTTEVAATKTIGEVQGLLVKAGARQIATEYDDDGRATGLAFGVVTQFGPRQFVLPVHPDKVLQVLERDGVKGKLATPEQAERVAWRIVKDWIEAQVAIIQTEMVTLDQVMLPYMRDGESGATVWELYHDRQLALPAAGGTA
jgi:hypothetical protein